VGQKLLRSR